VNGSPERFGSLGRHARVLLYHRFSEGSADGPGCIDAAAFDRQLASLSFMRWRPLSLDDYIRCGASSHPNRRFLLTIDDGYLSVLEIGAPILSARNVPAVVFVPPGCLGCNPPWLDAPSERLLNEQEVHELKAMGFDFGVHGMDHCLLNGLTDAELRRQIWDSREALADIIGERPRVFAYPGGQYDDRVSAAVARSGYEVAFAVSRASPGRLGVPRLEITGSERTLLIHLKLKSWYPRLPSVLSRHPRLRQAAHRLGERGAATD
jgi:peptidoglycan/xylan/chitin deacetylase (PgdA/CDA1 family)